MAEAITTQELHPARAVLRTVAAAFVGLFPIMNTVLLTVQGWLTEHTDIVPGWLFVGVNGVLVAALALTALVTRLLAIPGFNDWLRKYLSFLAPDSSPGRHVA